MIVRSVYNALLPVASAGMHIAGRFVPKVGEAIDGRRNFHERWRVLPELLGGNRPVWFHVASVGEYEQAKPVMAALAAHHPDIPVVLTFSSPSGMRFAGPREPLDGSTNIRFIDYLPADTRDNMRFCFDMASPRMVVLVKFDLWPNHIWTAESRGVPVVLIDATLSPSSRRLSGPGRMLYRPVYAALDAIIAISQSDAQRFRDTVPGHGDIRVAGDTRYDRVWERWEQRSATRFDYDTSTGGPIVICGSTWPADEAHLLPALARLLDAHAAMRVVIAPHEPTEEHVAPLVRWAADGGVSCATVTGGGDGRARVTILDTVGVLAEAYRVADIAYVGGSFSTGVHSVLEPAIAGLPVVFGPRHDNAHEALELIRRDAAFAAQDADAIHAHLERLVSDPDARARAGAGAAAFVTGQRGATEKCLAAIGPFL